MFFFCGLICPAKCLPFGLSTPPMSPQLIPPLIRKVSNRKKDNFWDGVFSPFKMLCGPWLILLLLVVASISFSIHSLRILIYHDGLSPSQIAFTGALADLLVQRGHTVDKLIVEFNPAIQSLNGSNRLRNVFRVRIPPEANEFIQLGHISSPFAQDGRFPRRNRAFERTRMRFCAALVDDHKLISTLRAARYHVYLTSVYLGCTFGLFHLLGNIPTLLGYSAIAGTDRLFPLLGIPEPPSYVSSVLRAYGYGDQLSFWARAKNEWDVWAHWFDAFDPVLDVERPIFEGGFKKFPPLEQIVGSICFIFLNTNELLDLAKPISAKIKYIGGIGAQKREEIPSEFHSLLSTQNDGFILFSFGSLLKTWQIPARIELEIVNGLCQFQNHTILWKYDKMPPSKVENAEEAQIRALAIKRANECGNLRKFDWLPQRALLRHPRIRLFITHLGLNSYLEAAHAGVPILAIPFMADQFYNAGCAAHKNGMGLLLEKEQLNGPNLAPAIREILQNSSYSSNALRIARMLAAKPNSPEQIFLENLEFAAQFSELAANLQMASANMPIWKLHNLDVFGSAICAILMVVLMAKCAWKYWKNGRIFGRQNLEKIGQENGKKRRRGGKRRKQKMNSRG